LAKPSSESQWIMAARASGASGVVA
jgi:hypothetical protein